MTSTFENDLVALLPTLRLRAARFVRGRDAISDLVQDTLVRCLAGRDSFQEGTNLAGWAFTIMRNLFINRGRCAKEGREVAVGPDVMEWLAGSTQPTQGQRIALVETARMVKALPKNQRAVIKAIRVHGVSYDEAAAGLGVTPGTIRSRLWRATRHLEAMAEGV